MFLPFDLEAEEELESVESEGDELGSPPSALAAWADEEDASWSFPRPASISLSFDSKLILSPLVVPSDPASLFDMSPTRWQSPKMGCFWISF